MPGKIIDWRAFCSFSGGGTNAALKQRGCVATRTAAGIYPVTLDQGIQQQELATCPMTSLAAGAPAATATNFKVINTTDLVKEIRYYDTGALADVIWSCAFGALQFA